MLIVLPVLRHCRHHPRDVINFRMLPLFVDTSLPRSISDERHDDESSKLEPRRWRWKHAQFRNIVYWICFSFLCLCVRISRNSRLDLTKFAFSLLFLLDFYIHIPYWYDAVNCRRLFWFFFLLSLNSLKFLFIFDFCVTFFLFFLFTSVLNRVFRSANFR